MNLGMCRQGDRVKVLKVNGNGIIRRRLLEMGFLKGAYILVVKYAPLRDPMEVVVGDAHISLRISEASLVEVSDEECVKKWEYA
ncbi:MAG TPA: FeoA family protein [Chitinispirillaceae bacterium]|nr:FeoA family protein [Chitinispirillaceae bacterium]